jgi:hypothetical protein
MRRDRAEAKLRHQLPVIAEVVCMTFWNGFKWVQDPPPSSTPRQRRGPSLISGAAEAGLIVTLVFGLVAGAALAAPEKRLRQRR